MRYIREFENTKKEILNEFQKYLFDFVVNMLNLHVLSGDDICIHKVEQYVKNDKDIVYSCDFNLNGYSIGDGRIRFSALYSLGRSYCIYFSFGGVYGSVSQNPFTLIINFFEYLTRGYVSGRKRIHYSVQIDEIKKFLSKVTEDEFKKFMATNRFDL